MPGPRVLLRSRWNGPWRAFSAPLEIVQTSDPSRVRRCLADVDAAVRRTGGCAAGFVAYEAAAAFGLPVLEPAASQLPLVWFGIYARDHIETIDLPPEGGSHRKAVGDSAASAWRAALTRDRYRDAVRRIRTHIEAGDTYQINFTWALTSAFDGDPLALFTKLDAAQRGHWGGYIDIGRHVICSASPELFFALDGHRIECRPMKGTSPRGRSSDEDARAAERLRLSDKNRAENVMVVDMTRNDLGRIARTGTVRVSSLYDLERYPAQWQMVSSVTAEVEDPSLGTLFGALFPSGSVTGAPKHRSMAIIRDLEQAPRGIYTGAIGFYEPGRAHFNVAIRTVHVDRDRGVAEFGVGSGIVWDSVDRDEFEECRIKASILTRCDPEFELLESIGWFPDRGFVLLDAHLDRLRASAAYFGFAMPPRMALEQALERSVADCGYATKIRLLISRDGTVRCDAVPIADRPRPLRAALASHPIDDRDVFLYHKTTIRTVYENALGLSQASDAVILWNARGEITEAADANVVVEIEGRKVTPPVECGLLPGVQRAALLARGEIVERRVSKDDLRNATALWLINSVRGWMPATLTSG